MKARDLTLALHQLNRTCDMNQRYHQRLAWRYKAADRSVKIVVALVAILAFAAEFWGEHNHGWAIAFAAIAALAAILLNVLPFGEVEKFYDELFHEWSDLRTDGELLCTKVSEDEKSEVPAHQHERYTELLAKQHLLNSKEPAPWRGLLRRCQEDGNQTLYGTGKRTHAQVIEAQEREKCAGESPTSSAAPAG